MPTLDERIEAARKLEGYTPGPWDASGLTVYDTCMDGVASCHAGVDARLIAAAPDLHRLVLDLAAERERLLALALKAFTVVEWVVGEGYLLEAPHEDADDLLLEMADALGVESSDEARAALASEPRA